jgi:catechol 2,3-dioxygenase-like lactoylglutathione lyase family enzyme
MAAIKHIAISARDNEKLAEFYKTTFGMTEVFRQPAGNSGRFAYYLSDGHINLAILPTGPNGKEGLNHIGFEIDDIEKYSNAALEAGASSAPADVPRDGRFAEQYILDPVGARIDLSVSGWATTPLTAEEAEARLSEAAPTIEAQ